MLTKKRTGILLPIASLPGKDIGNFGRVAYRFIEDLAEAGQKVWQILPIGPTIVHDSPFYSPSAFAINHNYIDLDQLQKKGFISQTQLDEYYRKFDREPVNKINYSLVWQEKIPLLRKAYESFAEKDQHYSIPEILQKGRWLDDYAEFMAIKELFAENKERETWPLWPEEFKNKEIFAENLKQFRQNSNKWDEQKRNVFSKMEESIGFHKFLQWTAFEQWAALKQFAAAKQVSIIGDCPIYVAPDSADVWANQQVFQLDEQGNQTCFAGVPPDYFSPKYGQFWGNPIYRWRIQEDWNELAFDWWARRLEHQLQLVDELRIDHFRGFAGYWQIPADNYIEKNEDGEEVKTAKHGAWIKGPGQKLFDYIATKLGKEMKDLAIIAEDLGVITEEVTNLRKTLAAPGMGIFQFAPWGEVYYQEKDSYSLIENIDDLEQLDLGINGSDWQNIYYTENQRFIPFLHHEFLPFNAEKTGKLVFYPGTHDNETITGWFKSKNRSEIECRMFELYLQYRLQSTENQPIHLQVITLLCREPKVKYAIFQMQDIFGLENEQQNLKIRTNIPNQQEQWQWKMGGEYLFCDDLKQMLNEINQM